MGSESWYAAKCIFLHAGTARGHRQMYEERIILLEARGLDDAIGRAEKEAEDYCRDLDGCRRVGYVNAFRLAEGRVGDGTEIFSSVRPSELRPEEYVNQFYPAEPDDCEAAGETHRWYNSDGVRSACYHCKVVRVGRWWGAEGGAGGE